MQSVGNFSGEKEREHCFIGNARAVLSLFIEGYIPFLVLRAIYSGVKNTGRACADVDDGAVNCVLKLSD